MSGRCAVDGGFIIRDSFVFYFIFEPNMTDFRSARGAVINGKTFQCGCIHETEQFKMNK